MKNFLKSKLQIIVTSLTLVITLVLAIIVGITVSGLNSQIDDLNNQIENLNDKNTKVDSDINNLESDLNNKDSLLEEEISSLENNLSALVELLETLSSQMNQYNDDNKTLEETIIELEVQIKCLKGIHEISTTKEIKYAWLNDYSEALAEGYCIHCENSISETVTTTYSDGFLYADFTNFDDQSKDIIITNKHTLEELRTVIENKVLEGITDFHIHTPSDVQIEVFNKIERGLSNAQDRTINLTISGAITIPSYAFVYDRDVPFTALKSIVLTDATTVNYEAFYNCSKLVKVDAPKVVIINGYSFYRCSSLVDVNMPELTFADYGSFAFCTSLVTISLPKLIITDENGLFNGCANLEFVYLPESLSIPHSMFNNCINLKYIYAPKVTSIGVNAFDGAGKEGSYYTLEITSPENITFGNVAFGNPSFGDPNPVDKYINLILNINKMSEVSGNEFNNYTFNSIEYQPDIDATNLTAEELENTLSLTNLDSISIKLPQEASSEMLTAINKGLSKRADASVSLILLGVEVIPYYAFCDNVSSFESLKSIYLKDAITVDKFAFSGCYYLEEVTAPNLITINDYGFAIDNLKIINLPLVETVGNSAFEGSEIESISLPSAITIGENAFNNCSYLTSVYIPKVTTIGTAAFTYCGFEEIELPSVTSIDDFAFRGMTSLRKVTFGSNVTHVGKELFYSLGIYEVDTTKIDLVFASGQKNFTGDHTNGWTISEEDIPTGGNVEFLGYSFKSITIV